MDSQYVPRYMKRRCVGSFQHVVRDEVVIARNALHQVVSKQRYEHRENLPSTPVPEQTDNSIYTPVHRSLGTDAKATYSKKSATNVNCNRTRPTPTRVLTLRKWPCVVNIVA